jgi:glycosyltransferase involved in cell wall biosynthesis
MRVLLVHNKYQLAGGEDAVFENEASLLSDNGHVVNRLVVSNDSIRGVAASAVAAIRATYNPAGRRLMADAIARARPDIVHVHNFFPLLSPAIFDACAAANVPAVWTLHNFRLTCANGLLFRDGKPCEQCVGGSAVWGIVHRCYRGSAIGSAAVAGMIGYHRAAGTWRRKVARFIALSEFSRSRFVAAGIAPELISVKPNFVADPAAAGVRLDGPRSGAVYVGRLSVEKGVRSLVEAWRDVETPLTVIGEGPKQAELQRLAPPHVHFAGWRDRAGVIAAMAQAEAVIAPSICYENFPVSLAEASAVATPILASRRGALGEIVAGGNMGLLFEPGDPADIARVVRQVFAAPEQLRAMGEAARRQYEASFAPQPNLAHLIEIYEAALRGREPASLRPSSE